LKPETQRRQGGVLGLASGVWARGAKGEARNFAALVRSKFGRRSEPDWPQRRPYQNWAAGIELAAGKPPEPVPTGREKARPTFEVPLSGYNVAGFQAGRGAVSREGGEGGED
jgi:hypothetical protein